MVLTNIGCLYSFRGELYQSSQSREGGWGGVGERGSKLGKYSNKARKRKILSFS